MLKKGNTPMHFVGHWISVKSPDEVVGDMDATELEAVATSVQQL